MRTHAAYNVVSKLTDLSLPLSFYNCSSVNFATSLSLFDIHGDRNKDTHTHTHSEARASSSGETNTDAEEHIKGQVQQFKQDTPGSMGSCTSIFDDNNISDYFT